VLEASNCWDVKGTTRQCKMIEHEVVSDINIVACHSSYLWYRERVMHHESTVVYWIDFIIKQRYAVVVGEYRIANFNWW